MCYQIFYSAGKKQFGRWSHKENPGLQASYMGPFLFSSCSFLFFRFPPTRNAFSPSVIGYYCQLLRSSHFLVKVFSRKRNPPWKRQKPKQTTNNLLLDGAVHSGLNVVILSSKNSAGPVEISHFQWAKYSVIFHSNY